MTEDPRLCKPRPRLVLSRGRVNLRIALRFSPFAHNRSRVSRQVGPRFNQYQRHGRIPADPDFNPVLVRIQADPHPCGRCLRTNSDPETTTACGTTITATWAT